MLQIPDDPVIRCMERTGYPPWMQDRVDEDDVDEDDRDVEDDEIEEKGEET